MARIAYFCSIGSIDTGAPISTLRTAELFAPDHEIWLVLPEEGKFAQAARQRGIPVVVIPFQRLRRFRSPLDPFRFLFRAIGAGRKLSRWLKQEKIDIIHFADLIDLPFTLAARRAGVKTVSHLRIILTRSTWKRIYRILSGWTNDRVICVSKATRDAMFPKAPSNCRVIYNPGPRPEFLKEIQLPPPIEEGFRVITIAKFLEVKGHLNLIETTARLVEGGLDIRATIIGGREPGHEAYYQRCMQRIEKSDLAERFDIIEGLSAGQVAAAIDASQVLVHLPNYQDPLPGVVLEGMARGRPVVAFDSGGVREEFEDGSSGILIPSGDVDGAAAALRRLFDDEELRQSMGQAARQFVEENFSPEKYKAELFKLYQELL